MITLFGIRHHGPGSARSVRAALEKLRPDCVLVEGPPEANALLPLFADPETTPPLALLIYLPDNPQHAVFYPFAEFSPEWQAIRYALTNQISVRFMDLEQRYLLVADRTDPAPVPMPVSPSSDPFQILAQAAGYSDSERWWERFIEQRRTTEGIFSGILELMTTLRAEVEALGQIEPQNLVREAAMRKIIHTAQIEGYQNIAIVCGAWHAPALTHLDTVQADEALLTDFLRSLSRDRRAGSPSSQPAVSLIPWTYDRLARRSGYGAGIDAPGWYEHLWQSESDIVEGWMVKVAQEMRAEGLEVSPAHAIEGTRLAETLAALRGHPLPGLPEVEDAIRAVFCFGDETPLYLIHEKLIVGQRMGKVPSAAPTVPLQRDLFAAQKRTRLEPSATPQTLDLDLRKPLLLERSRLLHRLNLLGIPWGELQVASGAKGTFHEVWRMEWRPEFAVNIIEASIWGNTLLEAATNKIQAKAARATELPMLTRLLEAALLADLPEVIPPLLERTQFLVASSTDLSHLMDALPPLINISRYGNVRQTDTALVRRIVDELITRVCIGLPAACSALNEEAAQEMFAHIKAVHQGIALLEGVESSEHFQAWLRTLTTLATLSAGHGLIRGLASRLLYDAHADPDTFSRMSLALSSGAPAADAAAWLQGFLHNSGQALIHDPALWQLLDEWVLSLSETSFIAVLPILRRTFSAFSAPERRQIGEFARNTGNRLLSATEIKLDPVRAEKALALVNLILSPTPYDER
jgi:hypothetical protein